MSPCAFCFWHGIWKSLQNLIISGKPINNNNKQWWWIPTTGVLELQDIPIYTSHYELFYCHMQYPWLTLPHATSQDPEKYLDKQARNNSRPWSNVILKGAIWSGSTVCQFHPMIRQPNLLTILTEYSDNSPQILTILVLKFKKVHFSTCWCVYSWMWLANSKKPWSDSLFLWHLICVYTFLLRHVIPKI